MSNQTILTNLEVLLAAVKSHPESNFNLSSYRREDEACGTLFCTAGLAGTLPHFNEQGLRWEMEQNDESWEMEPELRIKESYVGPGTPDVDEMFGVGAWNRLFSTYGWGSYDTKLAAWDGTLHNVFTDKELAIKRLELAIAELKGIAE